MKLVRDLNSHFFGRHEVQINQSFQELTSAKPPPVHRWVRVQDDLHGLRPSSDGSGGLFELSPCSRIPFLCYRLIEIPLAIPNNRA